jgi:hypothetical protein
MFADVGHFDQVGVEPFHLGRFAERPQVHVRRAGRHDDAGQLLGYDLLSHQRLAGVGTHVLVCDRANDAWQVGHLGSRLFNVDIASDILAAPTDKYTDSRHDALPFHHKVSINAERASVDSHGQPNQVGKIIDRHVMMRTMTAVDVGLFHIEIHVTHRAGHDDAVGPVLSCIR